MRICHASGKCIDRYKTLALETTRESAGFQSLGASIRLPCLLIPSLYNRRGGKCQADVVADHGKAFHSVFVGIFIRPVSRRYSQLDAPKACTRPLTSLLFRGAKISATGISWGCRDEAVTRRYNPFSGLADWL